MADKQQKLEKKQAELQTITEKVNYYDVAYVRFDVPEIKVKPPKITERPPRFGNIDEWTKAQNASIREQFQGSLTSYGKTVMDAAQKNIIGERKFRLMQQRDMEELGDNLRSEKYHRSQQTSDTLNLLVSLRSLTPPSWFVRWLLPSWVAIMSASLVLVVVLSVVRLAGMGARRMKRTKTSNSVAGYMRQKQLRRHAIYRQNEKVLVDNLLF